VLSFLEVLTDVLGVTKGMLFTTMAVKVIAIEPPCSYLSQNLKVKSLLIDTQKISVTSGQSEVGVPSGQITLQ
jgi:hypothetical protein